MTADGKSASASKGPRSPLIWMVGSCALLACVAAGAGWLRWRSAPQQQIPEIVLEGIESFGADEIAAAHDNAKSHPDSASAWGRLGMLLAAKGVDAQANKCFRHAHQLDPTEFRWPYLLAVGLTQFDPPAALQAMREALALRDESPIAHLKLAELVLQLDGSLEEAEKHLQQADAGHVRTHVAWARLRIARDDLDAGLQSASRAVELAPNSRQVRELLARVHQLRGEREEAMRELAAVERLPEKQLQYDDPYMREVTNLLREPRSIEKAHQLLAQNRPRDAVQLLRQAWLDGSTDPNVPCELAHLLTQLNELGLAHSVLQRASRQHPNSARVQIHLGMLFVARNDYQSAAGSFEEAIRKKPDAGVAYFYLGQAHRELGSPGKALEAFRALVRLAPSEASGHVELGRTLLEQGQAVEAAKSLQEALRLSPGDEQARELLGRAQQALAADSPGS